MEGTEVRFNGSEYEYAQHQLGGLGDKFIQIANDYTKNKSGGEDIASQPTHIEVTPVALIDSLIFTLQAYHGENGSENNGKNAEPSIFLSLAMEGEDLVLTEEEFQTEHLLTTREAFLLFSIGNTAFGRSTKADPTAEIS